MRKNFIYFIFGLVVVVIITPLLSTYLPFDQLLHNVFGNNKLAGLLFALLILTLAIFAFTTATKRTLNEQK